MCLFVAIRHKNVHKIQADFEFIARANSISYAKRIPLVYFNFTSLDFMHHNGISGNSVCPYNELKLMSKLRWHNNHFSLNFKRPLTTSNSVNQYILSLCYLISSFQFHRARPPRYISKIIIAFIWVISLAFSIPMAIALRVVKEHSYQVCKSIM